MLSFPTSLDLLSGNGSIWRLYRHDIAGAYDKLRKTCNWVRLWQFENIGSHDLEFNNSSVFQSVPTPLFINRSKFHSFCLHTLISDVHSYFFRHSTSEHAIIPSRLIP